MDWREQHIDPEASGRHTTARALLLGVLLGAAVAAGLVVIGRYWAAGVLGVVVVATTVARRLSQKADDGVRRVLHAVGIGVGRVLSWLLLGALAVLVIIPVWLISRLARWDMLRPRSADHGRWQGRRLRAWQILPDRPFSREERDTAGRRAHAFAVVALLVVLILVATGPGRDRLRQIVGRESPVATDSASPASPGDGTSPDHGEWTVTGSFPSRTGDPTITVNGPWAQDVLDTRVEIKEYDGNHIFRIRDVETEYFNYENRTRRSWQPPSADHALDVWFFGSSQLFGPWLIRDDYTISSEIAKLAWNDGVPIHASNFAIEGYVSWQQVMLMAQMLSERPAPDMVVFYGGYNDIQNYMYPGAPKQVSSVFVDEIAQALEFANANVAAPDAAAIERVDDWSPENSAAIYDRAIRLAVDILAARDIPFVNFLQPSLLTRDRPEDDATLDAIGADREYHETYGVVYDAARAAITTDVIDLSDALDDLRGVVYWDEVHHSEAGNAAVARAAYAAMRDDVRRIWARETSP